MTPSVQSGHRCVTCLRPVTIIRRGMCKNCYEYRRRRDTAYGRWQSTYVDAGPVRAHLEALRAAGLGTRRISALCGVDRKIIRWVATGRSERGTPPSATICRANAAKILAVPVPDIAHHMVAGRVSVDAVGTIRRLQALVAFGYPRAALAARLGITGSNATGLFKAETGRVLADTARRVAVLFDELQFTPGPSSRARNEGRRKGWLLPFEWDEDEIDIYTVDVMLIGWSDPAKMRRLRYLYPDGVHRRRDKQTA